MVEPVTEINSIVDVVKASVAGVVVGGFISGLIVMLGSALVVNTSGVFMIGAAMALGSFALVVLLDGVEDDGYDRGPPPF